MSDPEEQSVSRAQQLTDRHKRTYVQTIGLDTDAVDAAALFYGADELRGILFPSKHESACLEGLGELQVGHLFIKQPSASASPFDAWLTSMD